MYTGATLELTWTIFVREQIMLTIEISCFEYSADQDQLTSEKSTDKEPHCFPLYPCIYLGYMYLFHGSAEAQW